MRRAARPVGAQHTDCSVWVLAVVDVENCFLNHGLAGSGAAGYDGQPLGKGHFHGLALLRREAKIQALFSAVQLDFQVSTPCYSSLQELPDPSGQMALSMGGLGTINVLVIGCELSALYQPGRAVRRHLKCQVRRVQQLEGRFKELVLFKAEVTASLGLGESVEQALVHPLGGEAVEAHAGRDFISGQKANTRQFAEPVRVILYRVHGALGVLLVELEGLSGRDAVGSKERDNVPGPPVHQVGLPDFLQLLLGDPLDLQQLLRLRIKDIKSFNSEQVVDFLGGLLADALYLPGGKVSDNPFPRGHQHFVVAFHLELDSKLGVGFPPALHIEAQVPGGGQTVANGLDLFQHVPGQVFDLLAGVVEGHHVAAGAGDWRVDHPLKFT